MAFRVGQKVVFIGGGQHHPGEWGPPSGHLIGHIYTIREIDPAYIPFTGMVGIRTEEIHHTPLIWSGGLTEPATLADRFRPLIERKTDTGMAILRKLLDGNKIEEKV